MTDISDVSDLCQRLRRLQFRSCDEAADALEAMAREIERLKAATDSELATFSASLLKQRDEQAQEIERLTTDSQEWQEFAMDQAQRIAQLEEALRYWMPDKEDGVDSLELHTWREHEALLAEGK